MWGAGHVVIAVALITRANGDASVERTAVAVDQWFTDIGAPLGLPEPSGRVSGNYLMPEILMGGCTVFDHDGDDTLDIYVVLGAFNGREVDRGEPGVNRLYRQQEDGTFRDATDQSGLGDAGYGMMAAPGDYDDDGDIDLYVTNIGRDTLYRNNGDGTFTDVTHAAGLAAVEDWSTAAGFFDLDADGDLDLFVVSYVPFDSAIVASDDAGRPEYAGPTMFTGTADHCWRNNGDGTFTDVSAELGLDRTLGRGLGLAFVDLDGNGRADVYVANDQGENFAWITQDDGSWRNDGLGMGLALDGAGRPRGSMGVAVADLDGDGRDEVFVTHCRLESNTIYDEIADGIWMDATLQSGAGAPSLPVTAFGAVFIDAEFDGDLDLIVANGSVRRAATTVRDTRLPEHWRPYADRNHLFVNDGSGRFALSDDGGALTDQFDVGRAIATGDLDRDGDLDLVIASGLGGVRVLRNDVPRAGTWMIVEAREASGRHAIGATVIADAGERARWRRIEASNSYLAASEPVAHFGLGSATSARVAVRWIDGTVEEFGDVPSDTRVVLRRGGGRTVGAGSEPVAPAVVQGPETNAPAPSLRAAPVIEPAEIPRPATGSLEPPVERGLEERLTAVAAAPTSASAWGALGSFCGVHELHEVARIGYEQAMRLDPDEPLWPHLLATHLVADDPELALVYGLRAVELRPDYAPLRVFVARRWLDRGELAEAGAAIERAIELAPVEPSAHVELARLALADHRPEDAVEAGLLALRLGASSSSAHMTLAEAYRQVGEQALADEQRAIGGKVAASESRNDVVRDTALAPLGVSHRWFKRRADAALEANGEHAAIGEWRRAIAAWPENGRAHLELATLLHREHRWAEAAAAADRALALDASLSSAHAMAGDALVRSGNAAGAIRHLEEYVAAEPGSADGLRTLARAYRDTGQVPLALATFRASLDVELDGGALLDVGALLAQGGNMDGADRAFRAAIDVDPTLARAYSNLARVEMQRRRADAALEWLRLGTEQAPEDGQIRNEYATFLAAPPVAALRDLDTARAVALALNEEAGFAEPAYLITLASVLEAHGETTEARRWLERSIELLERNPAAAATVRVLRERLARLGG